MTDLVKRLRSPEYEHSGTQAPRLAAHRTRAVMAEAADEIERLQQRLMTVECELNAASDGAYLPNPDYLGR
jgi:hypothetical protein